MQEVITLGQNHPPQYIEKPLLSHFLAAQHLSCHIFAMCDSGSYLSILVSVLPYMIYYPLIRDLDIF